MRKCKNISDKTIFGKQIKTFFVLLRVLLFLNNLKKHIDMKKISILLLLIPMMLLFASCKSGQIKNLEKFTAQVEQNYSSYSNSDLEKAKTQFNKLVAKVENNELTGEEERHVAELKAECKRYFAQAKARILLEDYNNAVDEAGDEVKGALKSMQEE